MNKFWEEIKKSLKEVASYKAMQYTTKDYPLDS